MTFHRIAFSSGGGSLWLALVALGAMFVLAGVLIAIYPQILVALISGTIVLAGLSLIGAGLTARRAQRVTRPPIVADYEIIDPH